jgi:hypothetical protein
MSQLKMMVSTTALVCPSLPDLAAVSYQVPEEVLDSRLMKKGDTEVAQVLIKWSNISRELATSEDKEDLAQQFPAAPAWGQAAAQARGGVIASTTSMVTTGRKRQRKPNMKFYGLSWAE